MKRVGPELKMPEMKVPPFLTDLFYDLRKRGLLPIVALIVIAIAAVPFVLGGGSEEEKEEAAAVPAPTATASSAASGASRFAVVKAEPGLREYRKRLGHRTATDPFKQRYTAPQVQKAKLGGGSSSSTTFTSESETETGSPSSPSGGGASSPGQGEGGGPITGVVYTWALDLKIVKTAGSGKKKEKAQPETKTGIIPPATLPAEKAQVVTYLGVNPVTQKPLLLVSTEVGSAFGEWKCISGTNTCQLLEADLNVPETFVYGENNVRYKITILSVRKVLAPTAPSSSP